MKRTLKTSILIACFAPILFASCYFPGSDQAKIKSATKSFVKSQLKEGETFEWGHIERKNGRHFDNKDCKYAEVYYNIISPSGNSKQKILYLLMSEHCDSVYDITEETNKEWNTTQYPSEDEVKALIKEALKK